MRIFASKYDRLLDKGLKAMGKADNIAAVATVVGAAAGVAAVYYNSKAMQDMARYEAAMKKSE